MCDSTTISLIDEVVSQKVSDGEMFTAYDVTLAVQELLKKSGLFDHTQHRHKYIKNDVHRSAETAVLSGQYSRNLQNVGAPTPANVYFPIGKDPSNYVPLTRTDAPQSQKQDSSVAGPHTITIPALMAPEVDDDGDGSFVDRKPDARGTICVPAFLLRAVGFKPQDVAYTLAGTDSTGAYLSVSNNKANGHMVSYTVDHACNVRITKATLDYAGLNGKSYDFEADLANQCVVVREHTN